MEAKLLTLKELEVEQVGLQILQQLKLSDKIKLFRPVVI